MPEAAVRGPRGGYWREIVAVLCLKAVGLALLYFLFFARADRPAMTEQVIARHLLAAPAPESGEEVTLDR